MQAIATDFSQGMVDLTLQNATKRGLTADLSVQVEDAQKLSFADNTFDAVLSNFGAYDAF